MGLLLMPGLFKRKQSEGIKEVWPRLEIDDFDLMKPKWGTLVLLAKMRPHCFAFNIKSCKRCAALIKQDWGGGMKES